MPPDPPDRAGPLREFRDSLADMRLRLAAPLAVFIGLEQAFMYADFTKVQTINNNRKQKLLNTEDSWD